MKTGITARNVTSTANADAAGNLDADVQALQESFSEWIDKDLAEAKTALREIERSVRTGEDAVAAKERLFGAGHNIKGLGGSFGYPLLTDIADGLCLLLKQRETFDDYAVKVAVAHVNAVDTVINNKIQGDGGDAGRALLTKLETAVERALR